MYMYIYIYILKHPQDCSVVVTSPCLFVSRVRLFEAPQGSLLHYF